MGPSYWFLFLLTLDLNLVQCAVNFENEEVIRNIDLRGQIEVQTTKYTVRNIGDEDASSYIVSYLPLEKGKRILVQGYGDTHMGNEVPTREVKRSPSAPEGTTQFQIDLPEPIEPDESGEFHLVSVIIHGLKPFPAEILQGENQKVLYTGDAYEYSIYKTVIQRTIVTLASKNVEFFTPKKSQHDEDHISYGPFSDIEPLQSSPIKIHFENNSPFAVLKTAVREIEVSHWGNVAVEDSYLLQHNGAKLKGGFSRYDYQHTDDRQNSPSFRALMARIHPAAQDIYYRDEIGNISTSNVRPSEAGETLDIEIRPRYPMFGGWKVDFKLGYNIPAGEVLSYQKSSGLFVLNMTFGSPFPLAITDDCEMRIILPEGASGIKWSTDIDMDSEDKDTRITYLDTTGRPVLILRKGSLVGMPVRYFQVTYSFYSIFMIKEPILLITCFLAFFMACMIYVRIDLSISRKGE